MLESQHCLCAICGIAPAAHVDPDHETGVVRHVLCFNCHGGLGQFRDDPVTLRAAAEYVERHHVRQAAWSSRPDAGSRSDTSPRPKRHGVSRDRRCSHGFARWQAMQANA